MVFYCAAFSATAQIKVKSLNKKKWVLVESENFSIYTDLSVKRATLTATQLENYRAFCNLFIGIKSKSNPSKLTLFVTDSSATWKSMGMQRELVSLYTSPSVQSAYLFTNINGFFGSSFREANGGRSVVLRSIASEIFHNVGLTSYPYWFRTGLPFYLATYSEPKNSIMLGVLKAIVTGSEVCLPTAAGLSSLIPRVYFRSLKT